MEVWNMGYEESTVSFPVHLLRQMQPWPTLGGVLRAGRGEPGFAAGCCGIRNMHSPMDATRKTTRGQGTLFVGIQASDRATMCSLMLPASQQRSLFLTCVTLRSRHLLRDASWCLTLLRCILVCHQQEPFQQWQLLWAQVIQRRWKLPLLNLFWTWYLELYLPDVEYRSPELTTILHALYMWPS